MFNFPKYHTIEYQNNPQTGRFEKLPSLIAFNKMPFDLKIENTQEQKIINQGAKTIISGRIKEGKREFFTGLIPINNNEFIGNHYESIKGVKKLSLIIFEFTPDNSKLSVYFFNHYYIDNRSERLSFCTKFLTTKKGN
jgi:hypothetical protein